MKTTTTSTNGLAFSDVLSQQRKKERLAEVKKEIALRCQVVNCMAVFDACENPKGPARQEWELQRARLLADLAEERRLEEEERKP